MGVGQNGMGMPRELVTTHALFQYCQVGSGLAHLFLLEDNRPYHLDVEHWVLGLETAPHLPPWYP